VVIRCLLVRPLNSTSGLGGWLAVRHWKEGFVRFQRESFDHVEAMLANDYSERNFQLSTAAMVKGKSATHSLPLVRSSPPPTNSEWGNLKMWLKGDGSLRKQFHVDMICDCATLFLMSAIHDASSRDVISTTPLEWAWV